MWAPLTLPTREYAMAAPVAPNKNPVISRRIPASGSKAATGLPAPKSNITKDKPTPTSNAVPINSDK